MGSIFSADFIGWLALADFFVVTLILLVEVIDVARHWNDRSNNGR